MKEGIRRSVLFGVIPKASLHSSQVVDAQIQITIRGMTRKLVHVPHAHRVVAKVRKVRQQRSEQMERSVRSEGPKRFNDLKPRVEVYLKAILGGDKVRSSSRAPVELSIGWKDMHVLLGLRMTLDDLLKRRCERTRVRSVRDLKLNIEALIRRCNLSAPLHQDKPSHICQEPGSLLFKEPLRQLAARTKDKKITRSTLHALHPPKSNYADRTPAASWMF